MTTEQPPRRQLRRPGSPREIVHKVRVNADQEQRLTAQAAVRGITVSRLLVESALSGGADAAASRAALAGEMFRIVQMLGKVGVNINQLAKVANGTGEIPASTVHALAAIERVCDQLSRYLADLGIDVRR